MRIVRREVDKKGFDNIQGRFQMRFGIVNIHKYQLDKWASLLMKTA